MRRFFLTRYHPWRIVVSLLFLSAFNVGWAQEADSSKRATIKYGSKGFEFRTGDNRFLMQIQSRFQFRFATPQDQDPVTFDDFSDEKKRVLKINRARFKVGGYAFQPWIKYNWEYELAQSNL